MDESPGGWLCRCGHPREAHEHYRKGSDCSVCGPDECHRYVPPGPWWRRLLPEPRD